MHRGYNYFHCEIRSACGNLAPHRSRLRSALGLEEGVVLREHNDRGLERANGPLRNADPAVPIPKKKSPFRSETCISAALRKCDGSLGRY